LNLKEVNTRHLPIKSREMRLRSFLQNTDI